MESVAYVVTEIDVPNALRVRLIEPLEQSRAQSGRPADLGGLLRTVAFHGVTLQRVEDEPRTRHGQNQEREEPREQRGNRKISSHIASSSRSRR